MFGLLYKWVAWGCGDTSVWLNLPLWKHRSLIVADVQGWLRSSVLLPSSCILCSLPGSTLALCCAQPTGLPAPCADLKRNREGGVAAENDGLTKGERTLHSSGGNQQCSVTWWIGAHQLLAYGAVVPLPITRITNHCLDKHKASGPFCVISSRQVSVTSDKISVCLMMRELGRLESLSDFRILCPHSHEDIFWLLVWPEWILTIAVVGHPLLPRNYLTYQ